MRSINHNISEQCAYVMFFKNIQRWPGFQDKILITGDSAGCIFAIAIAHGITPGDGASNESTLD